MGRGGGKKTPNAKSRIKKRTEVGLPSRSLGEGWRSEVSVIRAAESRRDGCELHCCGGGRRRTFFDGLGERSDSECGMIRE